MKIGLYFGSFNPIHTGHLIIANHVLNVTDLKKIWFVVSPQNPFKPSATLLNEFDRLHLVRLSIDDDDRLRAMDIEFSLPKPSYTATTLGYLSEKYPEHQFHVIMGSDSYQNLPKWNNSSFITTHYPIIVYQRPGFIVKHADGQVRLLDAPLLDISATHIRAMVAQGKSIRYLVPKKAEEEIMANRFFRS
jgi:nicotinate-nucleotide adenylyltransferase